MKDELADLEEHLVEGGQVVSARSSEPKCFICATCPFIRPPSTTTRGRSRSSSTSGTRRTAAGACRRRRAGREEGSTRRRPPRPRPRVSRMYRARAARRFPLIWYSRHTRSDRGAAPGAGRRESSLDLTRGHMSAGCRERNPAARKNPHTPGNRSARAAYPPIGGAMSRRRPPERGGGGKAMNRAAGLGFIFSGMLAVRGIYRTATGVAMPRWLLRRAPVIAAAQPPSAERGPCRVTGPSQIVGWHVYVPAGLEARIDAGRLSRSSFAPPRSSCETATVDVSFGQRPARGEQRAPPRRDLRPQRLGGQGAPASPFLGFRAHASRPVELVTWSDENPDGHGLHAQAVTSFGTAVGPVLSLS